MDKEEKKVNRRDFLFTASYTVGAVGLGEVTWPLNKQMKPDKAQQALEITEVDISKIEPGKSFTVLCKNSGTPALSLPNKSISLFLNLNL